MRERERNEKRMSPRGESKQEKGTQKRERESEGEQESGHANRARAFSRSLSHIHTGKRTIGRRERAKNERAGVEDRRKSLCAGGNVRIYYNYNSKKTEKQC